MTSGSGVAELWLFISHQKKFCFPVGTNCRWELSKLYIHFGNLDILMKNFTPNYKAQVLLSTSLSVLLVACGGGSGTDGGQSSGSTGTQLDASKAFAAPGQNKGATVDTTTPTDTTTTTTPTTTTTTTSGPSVTVASCAFSAVQSAVNSAAAGTTVKIPAGDCNWGTSQLNVPGGVYLQGAGKDVTILRRVGSVSESAYLINYDCSNGQRAILTDMTLVGNGNGSIHDKGLGLQNGCVDFKVTNNKITKFIFAGIYIQGPLKQRGVIYKNDFIDNYSNDLRNLGYGVAIYGDGTWPALELGTQNAVFVEDNYMKGNRHHVASNNSSRYVFRYNTVIANDLTKDFAMTDAHGKSSSPTGSRSWEIYKNNYSAQLSSGQVYAAIGMRGGDGVIFDNTIGSNIANPVMLDLEGFSCGTYPATGQIRQAWIWNSGTIKNNCSASIQLGRDYFTSAKSGYVPYTYPHPLRS
jgi:hypothetical protein